MFPPSPQGSEYEGTWGVQYRQWRSSAAQWAWPWSLAQKVYMIRIDARVVSMVLRMARSANWLESDGSQGLAR